MTNRHDDRLEWLPAEFVWTPDELHRDMIFRIGVIVTAFGHVDYLAARLAVQASRAYAIKDWAPRFPSTLPKRVAFWRELLKRPGPLAPRAALGRSLVLRYERLGRLRNRIAHSELRPTAGGHFALHMLNSGRDLPLEHTYIQWTLPELRTQARRAARFSRKCVRLAAMLRQSALLPGLES